MKQRVLSTLKELNDEVIISESFSDYELGVFNKRYEQMVKRNKAVAELQNEI